jgi:hypothetical protein
MNGKILITVFLIPFFFSKPTKIKKEKYLKEGNDGMAGKFCIEDFQ